MAHPLINCVVSADYEVFLGRNFLTAEEVLFEPAQRMIDICDELEVPVTFFADVCSVWAHRKYGLSEYVKSFERQLKSAVQGGHDVQLHLHPHWLKSSHVGGEWYVATDQMYLNELGYEEGEESAPVVIGKGIRYLEELLKPVSPDYRCYAFRAAGLALQPDENNLIATLLNNGIHIDSSVARNVRLKMDTIEIDYTRMPTEANWYMAPETGIRCPADSGLFEVPVATFKSSLIVRIGFLWRRALSVSMRRGSGISRTERQTPMANLLSLLRYNWRYVSTDPWFLFSCDTKGLNLKMLLDGLEDYLGRHAQTDVVCLSMINHPKMMFSQQFDLLRALIEELCSRYQENIRFVTFAETLPQDTGKVG
jgi:hypothetical protein